MIALEMLLSAIREPYERAVQLRMLRETHDAAVVEETLIQSFFTLVSNIDDDLGWVRASRILLNMQLPLSLDALARSEKPISALRLNAVLAMPDVTTIESMGVIHDVIDRAISIGAPMYNNGDPGGCATLYWTTALILSYAPTPRGFPGQAKALKPLRQVVDDTQTFISRDLQGMEDFAWRLRRALDAARAA